MDYLVEFLTDNATPSAAEYMICAVKVLFPKLSGRNGRRSPWTGRALREVALRLCRGDLWTPSSQLGFWSVVIAAHRLEVSKTQFSDNPLFVDWPLW